MRAIVVTRHGGPEVLELQDWPDPEAGRGRLLVDVEAAGVNYRDIYEREGSGCTPAEPPLVAGAEGAGTVTAVGEASTVQCPATGWHSPRRPAARRKVALDEERRARSGRRRHGDGGRRAAAGHDRAVPGGRHLSVQSGDDVLVHAAAGGVGLLLTQVVKLLGGRVVATTSTEEKAALAKRRAPTT